jgi:hypothetical protein
MSGEELEMLKTDASTENVVEYANKFIANVVEYANKFMARNPDICREEDTPDPPVTMDETLGPAHQAVCVNVDECNNDVLKDMAAQGKMVQVIGRAVRGKTQMMRGILESLQEVLESPQDDSEMSTDDLRNMIVGDLPMHRQEAAAQAVCAVSRTRHESSEQADAKASLRDCNETTP